MEQQAHILRTQIANYKATGNYSNGKSLSELGVQELSYDVSDGDLQRLAQEAYKHNPDGGPYAFVPALSTYETKVFVRPGTRVAVVAFKGTEPTRMVDLYTDLKLARGHLSDTARTKRSQATLANIKSALPGYRIVLTGHSLGGSLAREMSNSEGVTKAVGFNTGYTIAPDAMAMRDYVLGTKAHHKKNHAGHPKFKDYLNTRDAVSSGSRWFGKENHQYYSNSYGLKAHRPSYFNR